MDKGINNNGFEYVDLCLPNGTLWATMNVGASNPSDVGLFSNGVIRKVTLKTKLGKINNLLGKTINLE